MGQAAAGRRGDDPVVAANRAAHRPPNVRAALEWAVERDPCRGVGLFAAMRDLFFMFAQHDGWRLGQQVLKRCPTRDRVRVEALITFGVHAFLLVDGPGARAVFTEAEGLSAAHGQRDLAGWAWFFQGLGAVLGGDVERARTGLEAARAAHQELAIPAGEAKSTAALGLTYVIEGDTATARPSSSEPSPFSTAEHDGYDQGQAHTYLAIPPRRVRRRKRQEGDVAQPTGRYLPAPLPRRVVACPSP